VSWENRLCLTPSRLDSFLIVANHDPGILG
jgi:hypothetical protein